MNETEIRHFHLFCGLGGGARGFNAGEARVGQTSARFRCLGGVDVSEPAVRDFERLAKAPGTVLDLFDREQYQAFHGHEPPADWREATPDDIRRAAGGERPHVVFTSPPCKGFSGLLSERRSQASKYQALNRLTLRGLELALMAWWDDPPEFFLLENVPRIANRGRSFLDEIVELLMLHGYAAAETTHDCGELGGLSQTRKRFLLVARHREKVAPFLYQPPRRPLRSVGELLETLPLPGDKGAGPMHRMRAIQWRTWVRLAFVEAGADWRSLRRLEVADGVLKDYALMPADPFRGTYGVQRWDEPARTITTRSSATTGRYSVADPRLELSGEYGQLGVKAWGETANAVTAQSLVGGGRFAIADPRLEAVRFNNVYRVVRWAEATPSVTGGGGPSSGGLAIADPRPRLEGKHSHAGHFGVVRWDQPSRSVIGSASHDNGAFNVADPRLPNDTARLVALIVAEDGTWHRPFTTYELAALQGLVDPAEDLELDGKSDGAWRERIGNAVPAPAAKAIADVMGKTLLLAWGGETFALDSMPVWVRELAVAIAVKQE